MNDAIFERACECIAGGVLSNFKKEKHSAPIYFKSADGCKLRDYDGNTYYDFSLSAGPAILGHSNEAYREVLKRQMDGLYTNWDSIIQIEAAEKIKEVIPAAELVRFCVSGVDAVAGAVRTARASTGKNVYVKFKGQYNGGMDFVLGGMTESVTEPFAKNAVDPDDYYSEMCYTEGRASHALDDCVLIEWNDLDEMRRLFEEHGDEIACVVMEPVTLNMNGCVAEPGYLEGVRDLCTQHHVVMIYDETLTGFRVALGGAAEYYGVVPDMCTFAKAIGGGFPVAAFVGKKEIMDVITDTRVLAVGTYNGHPLAAAAVLETIRQLEANNGEAFVKIRRNTDTLKEGLLEAAHRHGVSMIVQGMPGALFPVFTEKKKIINHRDALAHADFKKHVRFMGMLKERGILHNSRLCLSPAHTEEEIMYCIAQADEALGILAGEL
ncbi:MAG: aminotransferase class III-fold pyridoxal phosphate-dependent enzyme [Lachnospiraceae bacterium]|nr:aminotransferase class III-fold pyridoxal phosphate-dependent enzyme [Lachnospiraceae bacterium]